MKPPTRSAGRNSIASLVCLFGFVVAAVLPAQDTELLLASILKSAPTGIGMVENRRITQVNDYILELTGYSREELLGQDARILYPSQEDYDFVGREKYRQIAERGTGSVETRWRTKDGRIRHVLLSSTPLDPDNLAVGVTFTVLDIHERILAERALRESEERFSRIFQSSPGPLVVSEIATGEFIDVNESWVAMFGRSREEHLGRTSKELGIWSDPAERDRIVAKLHEHGSFHNEPIQFVTKSGEKCLALWSGEVIMLDGREVMLSLILDETERREAEAALAARTRNFLFALSGFVVLLSILSLWLAALLHQRQAATATIRESRNLLQTVLDTIPVRVFWKDFSLRYLGCNRRFAEDAGRASPAEVVGEDDFAMAWREQAERYRHDDRSVLDSGQPKLAYEEPQTTADGKESIVRISKLPLRNADGKVIGLLGTYEDITDRKRAEDDLRESEQRFQSFMDETPVYAYIKDENLVHIYQNQRVSELVDGDAPPEAPRSARSYFDQETAVMVEQADRRILAGETDHIELEYPIRIRGEDHWFTEIKFLLRLRDGRRAVGGMALDITSRKRAEAEKEKLWDQLTQSQKMESLGRLAGGVAHDFNNMLQAILGYTELAAGQLDPTHPLHSELGEIKTAGERAAELTRQLLAFARKQTAQPKVLDLNATVTETLGMLQRLIGEDIALAWCPAAAVWPVKVDPNQIGMVLTNLCVNARDAIAQAGKITIETQNLAIDQADRPDPRQGDFVMLAVSDNGCGMDRETLNKIFEPFFTTKGVGKGTGLGLASIHGIAEQNGGFVEVESEVGEGTAFRLYLPRHAGGHALEQPPAATDGRTMPTGSETILVVEDEPLILSICRKLLGKLGYRVLAAQLPNEAIALAQSHEGPIHLLVADVIMPEMDGRKLAATIAQYHPGVPCLFMSGYTADAIARHGILEEGVDFLQKPFENHELAEAVRAILDHAPLRRG